MALASITGLAIGLVHHFESNRARAIPGEGKRIIAFRQVTNRICTEHHGNLHRALDEAQNRVQRLNYVSRAIGWDVNDLEGITPPPGLTADFLNEVAVRRRAGPMVLTLQRAIELHRPDMEAQAIAGLDTLESESRELSRSAGIVRCMKLLPSTAALVSR